MPADPTNAEATEPEVPDTCPTEGSGFGGGQVAYPVTPVIEGNGGSWFQLYRPLVLEDDDDSDGTYTGQVMASWALKTNNLNNGADDWIFGIQHDITGPDSFPWSYVFESEFGVCKELGQAHAGFHYQVDAGAAGWSGSSSCSVSSWWKVDIGARITMTDGGFTVNLEIGGSETCSDDTTYDSESLLRGDGYASQTPQT